MKHNIRQRVINEYGLPVTKTETVYGKLGSGIFDRHKIEIFEGDNVQFGNGKTYPVIFKHATFFAGGTPLGNYMSGELEIIGHNDD